jgi:hypothetical protein
MKKIELTQGQVALVDDCDYEYLMQWRWCASWMGKGFRVLRGVKKDGKHKTTYIHTVIAERKGIDTTQIDHIDHNPLNNQRPNLRAATVSQNGHNRGANKNSRTGVKGVSFHKAKGKYEARIGFKGKHLYLGLFDTVEEAKKVVQKKRRELVGEFTCH